MTELTQVFDIEGRHKLVATDGRETEWAGYRGLAMLDGMVGVTAFWAPQECILTATAFCEMVAAKEEQSAPNT